MRTIHVKRQFFDDSCPQFMFSKKKNFFWYDLCAKFQVSTAISLLRWSQINLQTQNIPANKRKTLRLRHVEVNIDYYNNKFFLLYKIKLKTKPSLRISAPGPDDETTFNQLNHMQSVF